MNYIRLIIWYWRAKRQLEFPTKLKLHPVWHDEAGWQHQGYMEPYRDE